MVIEVSEPDLHESQQLVEKGSKRFNVLANGRRWGKSYLAIWLAIQTILDGKPVGYFVPTYEFGDEFWQEIKERLEGLISYRNESKMTLKFKNGATLKVWSLEKARAGRGRKYQRVIIDEAAFVKDLKESWEKAIRPTLTDYRGDAWFLSTPKGNQNYFRVLFDNQNKFDNWVSFQMASETNPTISKEELAEIESQLDELTYAQEFKAEFIDFNGRPFLYSFNKKKHVAKLGKPKISLPLYLSFDFNKDPITCIAAQHSLDRSQIRLYKEFKLANSDIYLLCDRIIAEYGDDYHIRITGDASGNNRSAMVADNLNYYKIIQQKLNLEANRFYVPNINPGIKNNRVLCNSLLSRHPDLIINEEMINTINDFQFVEVGDYGEIKKDRSTDLKKADLLDCGRYYFNAFFSDFVKIRI